MSTITASIERITPATAKTYLERMCENRKPKEATIAMYANDMQSNNWLLTPQGIAFDQGERLFDGQHRMLAIMRAGVTVDMLVLRGFPRDQKNTRTMDAIDCGVQRGIGDRLKIAGHKLNPNLAAAVARRIALDINGPNSRSSRKISLATTTAILGIYRDEVDLVFKAVETGKFNPARNSFLVAPLVFAAAVFPKKTTRVIEKLIHGAGMQRGSALLQLRNDLLHGLAESSDERTSVVLSAIMGEWEGLDGKYIYKESNRKLAWTYFSSKQEDRFDAVRKLFQSPS